MVISRLNSMSVEIERLRKKQDKYYHNHITNKERVKGDMQVENIGEAIKSMRKLRGLTQEQLEEKTGIKREYLSKIESSQLPNPTYSMLLRIADGLETKLSELIAMTEDNSEPLGIWAQLEEMQEIMDREFKKGANAERARILKHLKKMEHDQNPK